MQVATVSYQIASYVGTVTVTDVDENEETETIIARARRILTRRVGSLPYPAFESWHVTNRRAA